VLHPGETWHGFGDLEDDYCMLDPIKVSIVTPGVADQGGLERSGIPASLVTAYLHYRGVEVEKTTDFTILVLFSIGVTKGKWGTLLNALLDFKRNYDSNTPLAKCCRTSLPTTRPCMARSVCTTSPTRCSRSCASRGRRTGSPKRSRRCRRPS
jgi:arginine/lysine/ornithine decarboxylase